MSTGTVRRSLRPPRRRKRTERPRLTISALLSQKSESKGFRPAKSEAQRKKNQKPFARTGGAAGGTILQGVGFHFEPSGSSLNCSVVMNRPLRY